VAIRVDGEPVEAREGETVLAAIWANGPRALHTTAKTKEPRALLCGIGLCFDCIVTVDGKRNVRACMTPVAEGMAVELQQDAGWEGFGNAAA
jgi:predicted molibdopterin-dependent oxidoreductase YjgC